MIFFLKGKCIHWKSSTSLSTKGIVIGLITSPAHWFAPSCADGVNDRESSEWDRVTLMRDVGHRHPF
jgi:hypothetical protein